MKLLKPFGGSWRLLGLPGLSWRFWCKLEGKAIGSNIKKHFHSWYGPLALWRGGPSSGGGFGQGGPWLRVVRGPEALLTARRSLGQEGRWPGALWARTGCWGP